MELTNPDPTLIIAVKNNDGILLPQQGLADFLRGNRSLNVLRILYGRELFDILYDDHGLIRYEDNKLILAAIFDPTKGDFTNNILGKIGESVIVRKCNKSINSNQMWMNIASGKHPQKTTAEKFRAVGTGFESTRIRYPTVYNPHDTQRDIIWINDKGFHYQISGTTSNAGRDAGLQVKVSQDGRNQVYVDVVNSVYEVPIVYFDLSGDFGLVWRKARSEINKRYGNSIGFEDKFISGRDADPDAMDEIQYYADMIRALRDGRMQVADLLNRGEHYPSLGSALMASAMSIASPNIFLEASDS